MKGCFQQMVLNAIVLLVVSPVSAQTNELKTVEDRTIPAGYRVFSLKTEPLKEEIKPGDFVEIKGFLKDDEEEKYDVLENVKVFSMDSSVDAEGSRAARVGVLVTVKDAERLAMAQEHCRLQVHKRSAESAFRPAITLTGGREVAGDLYLQPSQSQVLTIGEKVKSAVVSNEKIVVQMLAPNKVRVGALQIGTATLTLEGEDWSRKVGVRVGIKLAETNPQLVDKKRPNVNVTQADFEPIDESVAIGGRIVRLTEGETERIQFSQRISRLTNSSDAVVRVDSFSPKELQLLGRESGRSRLRIALEGGRQAYVDVVVATSTTELESVLKEIFPELKIRIVGLKTSVVLIGEVEDTQQSSDIVKIAEDYYPSAINRLTTKAPQRVSPLGVPLVSDAAKATLNESNEARRRRYLKKDEADADRARSNSAEKSEQPVNELTKEIRSLRSDIQQLIQILEKKSADSGFDSGDQDELGVEGEKPSSAVTGEHWSLPVETVVDFALFNRHDVVARGGQPRLVRKPDGEEALAFQDQLGKLLLNAETAYWRLWEAKQQVKALEWYERRCNDLRARMPDNPKLLAAVKERRELYAAAQAEYRKREKQLRQVVGLASDDGRLIWPASVPQAKSEPADLGLLEQRAFESNPKLQELGRELRAYESQLSLIEVNPRGGGQRSTLAGIRNLQLQVARKKAEIAELRDGISREVAERQNAIEAADEQLAGYDIFRVEMTNRFKSLLKNPVGDVLAVNRKLYDESAKYYRLKASRMELELAQHFAGGMLLGRHNFEVARSVASSAPASARPHTARTRRFIVKGPSAELTRALAMKAEQKLDELSDKWFGEKPKPFDRPCLVTLQLDSKLSSGGMTSYVFQNGRLSAPQMKLQAPNTDELDSQLSHEVMHLVLASAAGKPLPRWLDEGLATIQESEPEQAKMRRLMLQFKRDKRLVPTRTMLVAKKYPDDMMPMFAQGHSLVEFLIERDGEEAMAEFLLEGSESGEWEMLLLDYFGFESVAELESEWLGGLE